MFEYAFMQNAFIVALLISIVCPLIGMFLVLRRYSMIGDALSHASLAGVAVGLLFDWNPVLSAFGLTSFFGILIEVLRRRFRRYAELILVIILSLSVALPLPSSVPAWSTRMSNPSCSAVSSPCRRAMSTLSSPSASSPWPSLPDSIPSWSC